jgi:hypothetical protein
MARYIRFTAAERRKLSGRPVPARVREIRFYAESPEQVDQSLSRTYALDAHKRTHLQTEIKNDENEPVSAIISGVIKPRPDVLSARPAKAERNKKPEIAAWCWSSPSLVAEYVREPFLYTAEFG